VFRSLDAPADLAIAERTLARARNLLDARQ
jgi:hypothetical protein